MIFTSKWHALVAVLKKSRADSDWLISMLSTTFPQCEIFLPNYEYQRPDEDEEIKQPATYLDNEDGLFNVPNLKPSRIKGR